MEQQKPKVFISSTVRDLGHVRMALKYVLERYHHVEVLASEDKRFPVAMKKDAITACKLAVEKCDLLICIIETRAGEPVVKRHDKSMISVTRAEFEHAQAKGIPTMTYVDLISLKLMEDFEKHGEDMLWKDFFSLHARNLEDQSIARFLAHITHSTSDNWITPYVSVDAILKSLEARMPNDFMSRYWKTVLNLGKLDNVKKRLKPTPHHVNLMGLDKKHRGMNKALKNQWEALVNSVPSMRSAHVSSLVHMLSETRHEFMDRYLKDIKQYAGKNRFLITDSSMDALTPDIWDADPAHREIVNYTKLMFKDVEECEKFYRRILLFKDLSNVCKDQAYHVSLKVLLDLHDTINASLGIVAVNACRQSYIKDHATNSFYIVEGVCVSIWDCEMGYWYYIPMKRDAKMYGHYLSMFNELEAMCEDSLKSDGLWVQPKEEVYDVTTKISGLIGAGHPG